MRLRFGIGERVGPFWAGVSLSPRRYFEQRPESDSVFDSAPFGCGCIIALTFMVVGIGVTTGLFVLFLVTFL
jgi:hypothetical protein